MEKRYLCTKDKYGSTETDKMQGNNIVSKKCHE